MPSAATDARSAPNVNASRNSTGPSRCTRCFSASRFCHRRQAAERPPVMGRNGGVSAGHPLTTAAAFEILARGGNAFDAGVAALLVGGVVEQDLYSLGGEALVLVYPRSAGKVVAVVGQGWAPEGATIDWYTARGKTLDGNGLDPAVVPGALHAALTVLEKWGTMSFEQVAARAIEYAEQGFPLRPRTVAAIARNAKFIEEWPDNQRYWLKPDGIDLPARRNHQVPDAGAHAHPDGRGRARPQGEGRSAGIVAARDRFYKGDIAEEMVGVPQASTRRRSSSPISPNSSPASKRRA